MLILSIFKSEISHKRIQKKYDICEWDYCTDIDRIRTKLVNTFYDLAIVDEKVLFSNDIIELLSVRNIRVIIFSGDFEELENELNELVGFNNDKDIDEPEVEEDENNLKIKVIEREKVIEKEIIKKETVYKPVYSGIENKSIGVISLSKGSGSSFITMNLVKAISDFNVLTAIVEPPIYEPYFYDAFAIKNKSILVDKKFISVPHLINEKKTITKDMEFIDDNISYLIQDPTLNNIDNWSYNKMMKLLYSTRSPISIIDLGYNLKSNLVKELINDLDILLVIIDPIPAKIVNAYESLNVAKNISGCEVVFVINKYNSGVNKKELINYLNTKKEIITIPYCNFNLVYESYNKCMIPYEFKEIRETLKLGFNKVIKNILPIDLLRQNIELQNKTKFRLFNKRNKIKE
jgi:hypothetical protein